MSTIIDHDINTLPVSMEFKATEDVATIVVPFAFKENIDDIHLEVNDVDSAGTYTYRLTANNVLTVTPSIPKGSTVYIYRETDVDKSLYTLNDGAVFTASNIDANFNQIRKSQQEVIGRFKHLKSYVDLRMDEAGDVIDQAKKATDDAVKATNDAKNILIDKLPTASVYLPSKRSQADKNYDLPSIFEYGSVSNAENTLINKTILLGDLPQQVETFKYGNTYIQGKLSKAKYTKDVGIATMDVLQSTVQTHKRKLLNFPCYHKYTDYINAHGHYYPNCFCLDDVDNDVYITTNAPYWVQVFDFHSREVKTAFLLSEGGSEGTCIYRRNGQKYFVMRGAGNKLAFYNITNQPEPLSTVYPEFHSDFTVGNNWYIQNDYCVAVRDGSEKGSGVFQRNVFRTFDLTTNRLVNKFTLDPFKTGFADQSINLVPKMQGFCMMGSYIVVQVGSGGYAYKSTSNEDMKQKMMQGYRILASDGSIIAECILDPRKVGDKLSSLGVQYNYMEAEGASTGYGKLYTFHAITSKDGVNGGWCLFEEMSQESNALDFSDCTTFLPCSSEQYRNGYYLSDSIGNYVSLLDGQTITHVNQFLEIMFKLQIDTLRISLRGTTIDGGIAGNLTQAGYLEIVNQDNVNFFLKVTAYYGNSAGYEVRAVRNSDGSYALTWQPNGWTTGNVSPRNTNSQNLGQEDRYWQDAYMRFIHLGLGIVVQSGQGAPEGRISGNVGCIYMRTDGSSDSTMYVKESGTGTTNGWVAK